jgi:hypothetical protein
MDKVQKPSNSKRVILCKVNLNGHDHHPHIEISHYTLAVS